MRGLAAITGWLMVGIGAGMLSIPAGLIVAGGLLLAAVAVPQFTRKGRP